jgi:hypothetical protein
MANSAVAETRTPRLLFRTIRMQADQSNGKHRAELQSRASRCYGHLTLLEPVCTLWCLHELRAWDISKW